jgi:hypothetical protein
MSRFRRETETESNLRNVIDIVLWALFRDNHTSRGGALVQASVGPRGSGTSCVVWGLHPDVEEIAFSVSCLRRQRILALSIGSK